MFSINEQTINNTKTFEIKRLENNISRCDLRYNVILFIVP